MEGMSAVQSIPIYCDEASERLLDVPLSEMNKCQDILDLILTKAKTPRMSGAKPI